MMVRVRYIPVPDRVQTFTVMLVDRLQWNLGIVMQTEGGSWTARRRGDDQTKAVGGWPRRSDAATYLALAGDFAQRKVAA